MLHAIGYTVEYPNFSARVRPEAANQRRFTDDGTAGGTLRMILGPAANQTHLDTRETVGGTNQANQIMRADQVVGQRMNAFDATPLNDAFGWNGRNIDIRITFQPGFAAGERTDISNAGAAAQTLFGSNGTGHRFDWTVVPVPAPPRRGVRQFPPAGGVFRSLPSDTWTFNDPSFSATLTDVSFYFQVSSSSTTPGGDLQLVGQASLTAQAIVTSPSLGLSQAPGTLKLSGPAQELAFAKPGPLEADIRSELNLASLKGSLITPKGTFAVTLQESPSLSSVGQTTYFSVGTNLWAVDRYFDVFGELSLNGGPFAPSTGSLYLGYGD
ncbi:MAG TPA: hypothetical protein VF173_19170 [Thermoanaerobaculia bacterium]|nr:hypothetical protein [Thermoanaerobaculia bacterium]